MNSRLQLFDCVVALVVESLKWATNKLREETYSSQLVALGNKLLLVDRLGGPNKCVDKNFLFLVLLNAEIGKGEPVH